MTYYGTSLPPLQFSLFPMGGGRAQKKVMKHPDLKINQSEAAHCPL